MLGKLQIVLLTVSTRLESYITKKVAESQIRSRAV